MKNLFVVILCGLFLCIVPQVKAEMYNYWEEIEEQEFYNPCTEEMILFSGKLHIIEKYKETKNGKRYFERLHYNFQGEGVGLTTGNPYYVESITNLHGNMTVEGNDQFTGTGVATDMLVNLETGSVGIAKYRSHVTSNANGEITVEYEIGDLLDYECSELED